MTTKLRTLVMRAKDGNDVLTYLTYEVTQYSSIQEATDTLGADFVLGVLNKQLDEFQRLQRMNELKASTRMTYSISMAKRTFVVSVPHGCVITHAETAELATQDAKRRLFILTSDDVEVIGVEEILEGYPALIEFFNESITGI